MKSVLFAVACLLFPSLLPAQSPFDGTWVAKPEAAQLPNRPELYSLQGGIYECESCVPRIKFGADGKEYPVAGSPYFSSISIQVVDDHTVEITEKLRDEIVYKEVDQVSADGNTMRQDEAAFAAENGEPVVAKETLKRLGAIPAGANTITGKWRLQKIKFNSQNGATVTYHSTAQGLQASNPGGEGYDAKFDGKEYPVNGEPTHSTVSLKKLDEHTILETDRQDGRVHYTLRMTVSRDGKTMKVTETDRERGTKMTYILEKKSA